MPIFEVSEFNDNFQGAFVNLLCSFWSFFFHLLIFHGSFSVLCLFSVCCSVHSSATHIFSCCLFLLLSLCRVLAFSTNKDLKFERFMLHFANVCFCWYQNYNFLGDVRRNRRGWNISKWQGFWVRREHGFGERAYTAWGQHVCYLSRANFATSHCARRTQLCRDRRRRFHQRFIQICCSIQWFAYLLNFFLGPLLDERHCAIKWKQ